MDTHTYTCTHAHAERHIHTYTHIGLSAVLGFPFNGLCDLLCTSVSPLLTMRVTIDWEDPFWLLQLGV
jgi:hypothetical protein